MYYLLHIPRTGGLSRRSAFADRDDVVCCGHNVRLSDVPDDATPVITFRDPVARFVSAYDHLCDNWVHDIRGATLLDVWPTAEALALDIRAAWPTISGQTTVFRPQREWVDAKRKFEAACLSTMSADLRRIGLDVDIPHENASVQHSVLSPAAADRLRDWYEQDYRLIASMPVLT